MSNVSLVINCISPLINQSHISYLLKDILDQHCAETSVILYKNQFYLKI